MEAAVFAPGGDKLCPAIAFDRLVGGKYKLRILWLLRDGPERYGALRRAIACGDLGSEPTPRVLSRELKELQQRGLISRHQHDVVPPRVDYAITDLGRTILPIVDAMIAWGRTGAHLAVIAASSSNARGLIPRRS